MAQPNSGRDAAGTYSAVYTKPQTVALLTGQVGPRNSKGFATPLAIPLLPMLKVTEEPLSGSELLLNELYGQVLRFVL